MRFFQRLAPGVREKHAVQPVLPPRFANQGAGLQEPGMPAPAVHAPTTPAAPDEFPSPASTRAETGVLPPGTRYLRPAAPNVADGTAAVQVHGTANLHTSGPVSHSERYATSLLRAAYAHEPPALSGAAPVHPTAHEPSAASPAGAVPRMGALGEEAPAPPAPQRPLSEYALAQRMQAPKNDTTVVHVTIDRIDVRAPATAQAPHAKTRPGAMPTTSLADYLRRGRS